MSTVTLFFVATLIASLFPTFAAYGLHRHHNNVHLRTVAKRASPNQIEAFLDSHNAVRALHNATALTWSPSLAALAESWADRCQFIPTGGTLSDQQYGENIVAGTGDFDIFSAVATFVEDQGQYDPVNPSYLHFTQVVWKSTTELGCALAECRGLFSDGSTLLSRLQMANLYVCLYNPAGNIIGQAPENVQL